MRKGFTRKPKADEPAPQGKNYITPSGLQRLQDEHRFLLSRERPAVTEVVAWAASNGDRSDNADYQYGKRRLRQIDGRIHFLKKRIDAAIVVDPAAPRAGRTAAQVFFGATVRYVSDAGVEREVSIVGADEVEVAIEPGPVAGGRHIIGQHVVGAGDEINELHLAHRPEPHVGRARRRGPRAGCFGIEHKTANDERANRQDRKPKQSGRQTTAAATLLGLPHMRASRHQPTAVRITAAFVPPNPNEFDIAARIVRFFALWGVRSMAVSMDGLSRLSVGGTMPWQNSH